jgi:polar amino acid transport system substrate-binding protein
MMAKTCEHLQMRFLALLIVTAVASSGASAASTTATVAPLTVSYIERPPFYMTEGGLAVGLVTEVARRVLRSAKIDHKFVTLGFDRIISDIKADKAPHCSIGWFKTQEREQYALFSLPIYQSGQIGALVRQAERATVAKHTSLESLLGDKQVTLGLAKGFSYGDTIDGMVAKIKPRLVDTGPRHQQLLKMLGRGRITYMLASADEIAPMAAAANLPPSDFALVPLSDVPAPEPRYFMCSKKVGAALVEQLNAAIKAEVKL